VPVALTSLRKRPGAGRHSGRTAASGDAPSGVTGNRHLRV